MKTMFLITRTVIWDAGKDYDESVTTDYLGVSDTLVSAQKYTERLVKYNYGVQVEWISRGWGRSNSKEFKVNAGSVEIQISPIERVNSRTTV